MMSCSSEMTHGNPNKTNKQALPSIYFQLNPTAFIINHQVWLVACYHCYYDLWKQFLCTFKKKKILDYYQVNNDDASPQGFGSL